MLFEPNDALSIRFIADYSRRAESCCGAVYVGTVETFDPTPGQPGDFAVRQPGAGGSPDGNRIIDVLTSLGGIIPSRGDPFNRQLALTPGTTYEGSTTDWGASVHIDWDLGGATMTSITAYRDYKSFQPSDTDYTNVDILRRNDDDNAFRDFQTITQEIRFQGSAFDGLLDWLVGGYFANEDLHVRDNLQFGSQYGAFAACRLVATVNPNPILRNPANPGCLSTALVAPGVTARASFGAGFGAVGPLILGGFDRLSTVNNMGDNFANYFQESTNWAIFTHNIFNITDQFALTLGFRYTHEDKDFSANFANTNTVCPVQQATFSGFLPGGATPLPATLQPLVQGLVNLTCQGNSSSSLNALNLSDERDESEWTGTGVLSFKPNNRLLLYASYSRGYKAGGFNLDRSALGSPIFSPTDPRQSGGRGPGFNTANLQFDPETVNAYEIGFKWTHRNFLLNVAAFHQQFSNFQLNTFNGSVFLVQNINGCGVSLGAADSDASNATGACPVGDVTSGVISRGVEVELAIFPARNLQFTAGFTYADTHYRDDLVGRDTGTPLDSGAVPAAGRQSVERAQIYGDGLGDLDSADRQQRHVAAALCRHPPHRRLQHRLRPVPGEGAGFVRADQRPARPARASAALVGRAVGAEPAQPGLSAGRVQRAVPGLQLGRARDPVRLAELRHGEPAVRELPRRAADVRHHRPLPLLKRRDRGTGPSPATAGAFPLGSSEWGQLLFPAWLRA